MNLHLPERFESQRLVFRPPVLSDALAMFNAYTSDSEVSKYMTWKPHVHASEQEGFLAKCIAAWADGSRFSYVLILQGQKSPIGMLDAIPNRHILDIGYVLARNAWGKGLMPEAVNAFCELAFSQTDVFRIQATCDVANVASARTLEKSGFVREGRLDRYTLHPNISDEPQPCFMYARCR